MGKLTSLRCNNHGDREAAALCSSCKKPHCRECVTEHDGKVLCTGCLSRPEQRKTGGFRFGLTLLSALVFSVSLSALVLLFGLLGKTLLNTPSALHEGSIWQSENAP